jgi:hypothetical protein
MNLTPLNQGPENELLKTTTFLKDSTVKYLVGEIPEIEYR